jgi:hypothetical protein
MLRYYEESHINSCLLEKIREGLNLKNGNVLVWNRKIVMESAGRKGAGFILIKYF